MSNSLLDIQPHKVSRNLKGYSVLFYGAPKSGKTTIASKFPSSLLLAFEKGYSAIPGIMAKPMNSWGDFKKIQSELKDPLVKERFQTIVIDTADIAYSYCEKYICSAASDLNTSYEAIADIPFGAGYKMAGTEFDEGLRRILQMGYGLVLISHSQDKTLKNENGSEYNQIMPTLDNRARLICERTCDIIAYSRAVDTEEGPKTKLFLRGTPRFVAGSRFKYTPPVIDFDYENLVKAIADAIDEEERQCGKDFVTEAKAEQVYLEDHSYDFPSMINQFKEIANRLIEADPSSASKITSVVDKYLGKGKRVGDCTESNAPQLDLILFDLRQL